MQRVFQGNLGKDLVQVGDSLRWTRVFTAEDVATFAKISGDHNPLHVDPEFAATTRFGKCIVHGIFVSSMFSTMFATTLPGAVYLQQSLAFRAPVFVGDTVTASLEVQQLTKRRAQCVTNVEFGDGSSPDTSLLVEGSALVLVPPEALE